MRLSSVADDSTKPLENPFDWLHTQRHRSYDVRTIHVASSSRLESVVFAFISDDMRHLPYDSRSAVGDLTTRTATAVRLPQAQWVMQSGCDSHYAT
jgi:hypothetical protein